MARWYGNGWLWASAPDWGDRIGPDNAAHGGKWLLFVREPDIWEVWETIASSTEAGMLGGLSKVITEPQRAAPYYALCVYTADYRDRTEVTRVLAVLRELGCRDRLFYKEDATTRAGLYSDTGPASLYEAAAGSVQIRQRREPWQ